VAVIAPEVDRKAVIEARRRVICEHGPWIRHSIHLVGDLYTEPCGREPSRAGWEEPAIAEMVRLMERAAARPIGELRVLEVDPGEGLFSVALARRGARVVALSPREDAAAKIRFVRDVLGLENLSVQGAAPSGDIDFVMHMGDPETLPAVAHQALWGVLIATQAAAGESLLRNAGFADLRRITVGEPDETPTLFLGLRTGDAPTPQAHRVTAAPRTIGRTLRERLRLRTRFRTLLQGAGSTPEAFDPPAPETRGDFDKYRRLGAYHWSMLESDPSYRARVQLVMRYVNADAACLDLGCGDGAYIEVVAPQCRRIVGVDADETGIRLAEELLAAKGRKNVELIQARFSDLPKGGEPFELVYSMDCIEHLERPAELLDAAAASVKPEGRVLIGTPEYHSDEEISPYHVREYREGELRELLAGWFEIESVVRLPAPLPRGGRMVNDRFMVAVCRLKDR
jgi:2-polyprenyl-3-methyl-5-hydroxy-6-metoxy-1,4-benzoquinol methylase